VEVEKVAVEEGAAVTNDLLLPRLFLGEYHHGAERETMVAGRHGVPPPGKVIGRGLGRRECLWEPNKIRFCL